MAEPLYTEAEIRSVGDALTEFLVGLGLPPTMIRPYAAAVPIMDALTAAGWRKLPDGYDENVRRALRRVTSRFIANAHLLNVPFTNEPSLSPWILLKLDLTALKTALSAAVSLTNTRLVPAVDPGEDPDA